MYVLSFCALIAIISSKRNCNRCADTWPNNNILMYIHTQRIYEQLHCKRPEHVVNTITEHQPRPLAPPAISSSAYICMSREIVRAAANAIDIYH